MRLLFDENIPIAFLTHFPDFECSHVVTMGWGGRKNGALIASAVEHGFSVFMTYDSGISHQNPEIPLSLFVLKPEKQGLSSTVEFIPQILELLQSCSADKVYVIRSADKN